MDFGRLFKWVVVIALIVFGVKVFVPWVKQQKGSGPGPSITAYGKGGGDDSCVDAAERASESWGSGLGRFVNPPYDMAAWSAFRGGVDNQISAAESKCTCAKESCEKVRQSMRELRSLVSDLDAAIRSSGSPGSDVVARQEHIDVGINEARDLMSAGK
jgi:hypothetical protein